MAPRRSTKSGPSKSSSSKSRPKASSSTPAVIVPAAELLRVEAARVTAEAEELLLEQQAAANGSVTLPPFSFGSLPQPVVLDDSFESFQPGGQYFDFFEEVNPANASAMATRQRMSDLLVGNLVLVLSEFSSNMEILQIWQLTAATTLYKIAERIPSTHSSALIIDTSLFVPVGNQLLVDGLRNQIHADMFAIYPPIAFTNSLVNSRSNPVLVDGITSIPEVRMLAPTNTEDKRNISVLRFFSRNDVNWLNGVLSTASKFSPDLFRALVANIKPRFKDLCFVSDSSILTALFLVKFVENKNLADEKDKVADFLSFCPGRVAPTTLAVFNMVLSDIGDFLSDFFVDKSWTILFQELSVALTDKSLYGESSIPFKVEVSKNFWLRLAVLIRSDDFLDSFPEAQSFRLHALFQLTHVDAKDFNDFNARFMSSQLLELRNASSSKPLIAAKRPGQSSVPPTPSAGQSSSNVPLKGKIVLLCYDFIAKAAKVHGAVGCTRPACRYSHVVADHSKSETKAQHAKITLGKISDPVEAAAATAKIDAYLSAHCKKA